MEGPAPPRALPLFLAARQTVYFDRVLVTSAMDTDEQVEDTTLDKRWSVLSEDEVRRLPAEVWAPAGTTMSPHSTLCGPRRPASDSAALDLL